MKFYVTRWRYAFGYILVIILAILATWSHDKALDSLSWAATVFAVILFIILELLIRSAHLTIGRGKIFYSEGLFKKKAYLVNNKVHLTQTSFQKLLRLCDIHFSTDKGKVVMRDVSDAGKLKKRLH